MRLKLLAALIACNLVWSAHPLMGKWLLESATPLQGAWLRYASALLAYLAFMALRRHRGKADGAWFPSFRDRGSWGWAGLMGAAAFALGPTLQLTGLQDSQAADNALIIAMEPLIAVGLAALFLGERITRAQAAAFVLALGGFALLTGFGPERIARGLDSHLIGNLLILVSLLGEASNSVIGKKLSGRTSPERIYGAAALTGAILLTAFAAASGQLSFSGLSFRSWLAVLWMGPLGTAGCYLFWQHALLEGSVSALSLTLFVQPVMGAILGAAFLGDRLSSLQLAGGALILIAVGVQAFRDAVRAGPEEAA